MTITKIVKGADLSCKTCGIEIKVGDTVIKKQAKNHSTIRHESCARRVGLID